MGQNELLYRLLNNDFEIIYTDMGKMLMIKEMKKKDIVQSNFVKYI